MDSNRSSEYSVDMIKGALAYYQANSDVTTVVENSLNDLFLASPHDIYGFLAEYYEKYEKPAILSRFEIQNGIYYDSKCQPTLKLNVYCIRKNKEIKLLSIDLPCYSILHDSSRIELIKEDDQNREKEIEKIRSLVNGQLSSVIKFFEPQNQNEIDARLSNVFKTMQKSFRAQLSDEQKLSAENTDTSLKQSQSDTKKLKNPSSPKLKSSKPKSALSLNGDEVANLNSTKQFQGAHILSSLSKAVCLISCQIAQVQPFIYLNNFKTSNNKSEQKLFSMAKPLVTILQNGKGFNGKQSLIKEFILFPKSFIKIRESIDLMSKIHRFIRDNLYQSKQMPGSINKCITDIGSLQCTLETPQSGIDILESAIQAVCGEDHSSKFSIALNVSANELFDQEKMKYEIASGSLKSSDEIIEVLNELITKNPRIQMIIDPFIKKDLISWYKLYARIGKQCVIANIIESYELSSVLSNEIPIENEDKSMFMPLNLLKFENCMTITELNENIENASGDMLMCGLSCSVNETNDSFIVDLAIANNAKFIKIGGLSRSERVEKLNRLIEIENYLHENKQLEVAESNDINQLLASINIVTPPSLLAQQLEESTKHKKSK